MFKIQDIFSAMEPLYFLSKILGVAPYSYVQPVSGSHVISTSGMLSILWTLIVSILMSGLFIHILLFKYFTLSPGLAASYLIIFGFQKISLVGSSITFLLLGATINRSKIKKIMENLSTIDKLLLRNKPGNMYKGEFYFLISQIMLVIVVLIGMFYYYVLISSDVHNILFAVFYVMTLLINSVGLIQFLFLLRILKLCFKRTSEELEMMEINCEVTTEFFKQSNILGENPGQDKKSCSILTLRSLHFKIYESSQIVNTIYGLLMLIETSHNFVSVLSLVDITLILLDREQNIITTVYYMCWLMYYTTKMTVLMLMSQMTCSESRKILAVLHKLLLLPNLSEDCERQLRLFVMQVINNRIEFTASGIFPLDLPTLHSIVSAATTYIIVFDQLRRN
jgi:hypothetical protein